MIKQTIFVIAVFLVSLAFARYIENDRAPVENQEALLKDLKDRLILLELEKLSETPYYNNKYNKRSDIDSRLLEWQAKIKQLHHLNDRLPGHGKIDFEDIGKRK